MNPISQPELHIDATTAPTTGPEVKTTYLGRIFGDIGTGLSTARTAIARTAKRVYETAKQALFETKEKPPSAELTENISTAQLQGRAGLTYEQYQQMGAVLREKPSETAPDKKKYLEELQTRSQYEIKQLKKQGGGTAICPKHIAKQYLQAQNTLGQAQGSYRRLAESHVPTQDEVKALNIDDLARPLDECPHSSFFLLISVAAHKEGSKDVLQALTAKIDEKLKALEDSKPKTLEQKAEIENQIFYLQQAKNMLESSLTTPSPPPSA